MVKHRGLNLRKFIFALPWPLFEAYFERLDASAKPDAWSWMNPERLLEFLNDEANAEATGAIVEDFSRINDISVYVTYLLYAYQRSSLDWDDTQEHPVAASMRLFLEDREAFEFAWTLYLLQAATVRRYEHFFPAGDLAPSAAQTNELRAFLTGWHKQNKNGDQCIPTFFKDGNRLYLRVARGTHFRTVARWRGHELSIESFRPAAEDVLTYDASRQLLCMFGGTQADRKQYIEAFAAYVVQDSALATVAFNTHIFSLAPIRRGDFSYSGFGDIRRVRLGELGFLDPFGTMQHLRGDQVFSSLRSQNLHLEKLDVRKVGLVFVIQSEGMRKAVEVPVMIQPPFTTDLAQKRYSDLIEGYLRQQGVKLL